jgi:putative oxidoreductase
MSKALEKGASLMKIAATIARYLLGLLFLVFGLNGFLHFIKLPPPTNPLAISFYTGLIGSHYAYMFFAVQVIGGVLLLAGYFVPVALIVLAAEIVNILTFHVTMEPSTIGQGILPLVLWLIVFVQYRGSFAGVLAAKPTQA